MTNVYSVIDLLNDISDTDNISIIVPFHNNEDEETSKFYGDEEAPSFYNESGVAHVGSVVFHSSKANASINTIEYGTVALPDNDFGLKGIPSHRYKTINIIKDGKLNVDELDLIIPTASLKKFENVHFAYGPWDQSSRTRVLINLRLLPLVNETMIGSLDFDEFTDLVISYYENSAEQKVAKANHEKGKPNENIANKYGEEAAKWLYEIGVRDYGFSPPRKKKESDSDATDTFLYKVKGLSSLPSLNAVAKKVESGKNLTISESLINHYVENGTRPLDVVTKEQRRILRRLSEVTYAVLVGKAWFNDDRSKEIKTAININDRATTLTVSIEEV